MLTGPFLPGFRQKLEKTTREFCDLTMVADRKFHYALVGSGDLGINEHGDVATEIERFDWRLREYRLALKVCLDYCDAIAVKMQDTIVATERMLSELSEKADPAEVRLTRETLAVLRQQRGILGIVQGSCNQHLLAINNAASAIAVARQQRKLGELVILAQKLEQMREDGANK